MLAWRRPALPPLGGQYPGRGAVSRPSSEWGRVGPARCDHQAKTTARSDQASWLDPGPAAPRSRRSGWDPIEQRRSSLPAAQERSPKAVGRGRGWARPGGCRVGAKIVKLGAWVPAVPGSPPSGGWQGAGGGFRSRAPTRGGRAPRTLWGGLSAFGLLEPTTCSGLGTDAAFERLGPLGCTGCPASTCGLSTWWSTTALGRDLVLRRASRLDALSGYPDRT